MTETRRDRLRVVTPPEYFGWKRRTGGGYSRGARHFATEVFGTNAEKDDIDFLSGRFHRWEAAKKKREEKAGAPSDTAQQLANTLANALPQPVPIRSPESATDIIEAIPGSLADLAVEGSEEDWLVASLMQLENAVAKRLLRGHDITGVKKLATELRKWLGVLRKPPMPSLDELPEEERRLILEAEVPGWPDYVLKAARVELERREEDDG